MSGRTFSYLRAYTWLVRYADDFVVVLAGQRKHAEALAAETAAVLAPLGLTLSQEKTRITHIDAGAG